MVAVLLIRADGIRHRALSGKLVRSGLRVLDFVVQKKPESTSVLTAFEQRHFEARDQFERDYFQADVEANQPERRHEIDEINSLDVIQFAAQMKPDLVVTFGCPILQQSWIETFKDRLLGIHLGLSPYFRGSGTNIWPLSRGLPEAIGFTLMKLDAGIDTGAIVHQHRAQFVIGDSVHSVNCRLMQHMFTYIASLATQPFPMAHTVQQPSGRGTLVRRRDMTVDTLRRVYENFSSAMVEKYLSEKLTRDLRFPLIHEQPPIAP